MSILELILAILVTFVTAIYFYIRKQFRFWLNRNIPYLQPKFPYGNLNNISKTISLHDFIKQTYLENKGKSPVIGFYSLLKPVVMVTDLELMKNILIKDFNNFTDRFVYLNEKADPISGHLFALPGEKWRPLRAKLSPTFTSGKMKLMFPTIIKVGDIFKQTITECLETSSTIDMKDILDRFTVDVIGSIAFGIECNSLKNPNAEFRQMGRRFFEVRNKRLKFEAMIRNIPSVGRFFGISIIDKTVSDFFSKTIRETVEYREKNQIERNDFLNLLIAMRENLRAEGQEFTIEQMAAQSFVFFAAGFETSSTVMGFLLFELAKNQEIQEKLRGEILSVIEKHNGEFTYEAMVEMKYLDQVIMETLRKYSIVSSLTRKAINDYKIPNSNLTIPKDTIAFIPIYGIQHDPEIYPDPEVFDPDRFTAEEIQKRHSLAWMPFGDGPRNCIGLRFGKMQTSIGIVSLLRDFKFSLSPKTTYPLKFDITGILLSSKELLPQYPIVSPPYKTCNSNYILSKHKINIRQPPVIILKNY